MPLISLDNLSRFKDKLIEEVESKYGEDNGIAELDENGAVPEEQLPSSVFNIMEYATFSAFPEEGEEEKIYVDKATNNLYRWDGTDYISLSSPESIKYTQQSLTDAQKTQARTNIGAISANEITVPENVLTYSSQTLTTEQKTQARTNIDAASAADVTTIGGTVSSISSLISSIQAEVQVLGENVSDVVKTESGLRIEYANGTSKNITLESDFPIKSVVYDENHFLHFYDENNNDLFDNVYIEGGGGGGASVGSIVVTRITNDSINCVYGASVPIEFSVTAKDASDDRATLKGSSWTVNGIVVARNVPVVHGNNSFDIGPYLNAGDNTIKITVTADTGGDFDLTGSKTWQVNAVNMRFDWNYDDAQINTSGFTDVWTVYGDVEKTSHTVLDGFELPTTTTTKTGATQSIQIPMQEHGIHTVERWLTATIGGTAQSTDHQYHEMIFAVQGNLTPIISIALSDTEMNQYDTIRIPVVVYDPTSVLADAVLYVDSEEIGTWDNIDRSVQYWSYTPNTPGDHVLTVECGQTTRSIVITVNEVELDVEEVPGYTFKFKSSDFASNSAAINWESNGVTATYSSNFDWINGGLHTEEDVNGNLQQYFCIKAGTRMTINNKLFATDPKARGMTFKIVYKVENCRNYDAQIMHCYSNVGLRMYAHNAIFNSTGQSVSVPYGEDEYIELEFDVYPVSGYRYMMAWADGVITTCRVYDTNDSFVQAVNNQENIVIGSDDCDVYIYMVKSYPMLVDRDGHINNFIMDAPNASEMSLRYNRNNILDESGEISYTKLANNNPDCRVWLYDVPYITIKKDDKVSGCNFQQFWKNGDQYYQLSGSGKMSVQGTSSEAYAKGAANTDINFSSLEDGNGNNLLANGVKDDDYGGNWFVEDENNPGHAKIFIVQPNEELGPECVAVERDANRNITKYIKALGFKINDNSCPITYSNTKVNFASCEQVNNMCNAEWYQRYNPYQSLTSRDCMEFEMGVQFIKDSGTIPDDSHYVLWGDNKYHMYSIGNMGNSKKNVHVFHDLSNANDVCIEVNDNNDDQMRMVNPNNLSYQEYFAEETWNGKKYYGMRYPDTKNPSSDIVNAWYRLVWWMANSDPGRPTGELLPQPETYGDYTFRGHDRPGTQVLKGTTITQYSGTYTHDTFERRMAKMLSECEDYMVMDSFMYHYIYLERHTMVDNVSKNNFWSSTDLIHWDLSKAYDMDTSDGNNNQGQLKFDYGNEWNDYIGNMRVFNGGDSVWFVFCANLYEACRTMFTNREAAGAWSASAYHNFLLSRQRKVPERCWVQCYWYDYLRTYEDGISDEWMTFLDGGQKTHQRKHYEFFEELYDSSKYRGVVSTSSNINFRAYTPNEWKNHVTNPSGAVIKSNPTMSSTSLITAPYNSLVTVTRIVDNEWRAVNYGSRNGYIQVSNLGGIEPNGEITITMYNKMYISVDAGTKAIAPIKAERGQPVTIPFDVGYINNMLVVVNTASMIQEISGLEQLYPDTCVFAGAVRLRELNIGSAEDGYENTFLRTLALGNNTMLERLNVQNLPNADSPIDLSNCPSLLYIDASGSGFTAYTFADGGLLENAIINKPTSLSLMNLAYLDDEHLHISDYSALISLRFENTPNVDSYVIVTSSPSLQIARLIGIDWTMPNATTLDRLLTLQGMNESNITIDQSVLAGSAYAPSVKQRTLDEYNEAWPDLTVDYDNIVEEFLITFVNPDGTPVLTRGGEPYTQYVDRGQNIIDPVVNDLIDAPTMESTAQFDYSFNGWENITGAVMDSRTVVANYISTTRTYRVRWYAQQGVLLKTEYVEYGSEAIYQDQDHVFPPTKTDEEDHLYFWVFENWNKSTGYITENIDVYAIWDHKSLPAPYEKNLKDMSPAEIYAVAKTYRSGEPGYFRDEDYIDITVGKDFEFENVQSRVLLENKYFNGSECVRFNDIKLFDVDAPSFTIALDYEFATNTENATIMSCCDAPNSIEGFRVYHASNDNSVRVLWGNNNQLVDHGLNRNILVLRHRKGSKNLLVCSGNNGRSVYHVSGSYGGEASSTGEDRNDGYSLETYTMEIPRAQETLSDCVLGFGAMPVGTSGYQPSTAATGWVYWCKIWFDDLGIANARQLASWPHETWRMHYRGNGYYNKDDSSGSFDGASFIANAPLAQVYNMYSTNSTTGGWNENTPLYRLINGKCFNAMPYSWQSIISPVIITTKGGSDNPNMLTYQSCKMYIPALADIQGSTANLISSEGTRISWFVEPKDRIKFNGITIPEDSQFILDVSNGDPTLYTDMYRIKEGDVWILSGVGYIYLSEETRQKHGFIGGRRMNDLSNNILAQGAQGGIWIRAQAYWERTNSSDTYHYICGPNGSSTTTWLASNYQNRGIVLMFSI